MASQSTLRFENLDGRWFSLSSSSETLKVKSVKPMLEDFFDIPVEEQELVYHDTDSQLLLHDEAVLRPCYTNVFTLLPKPCQFKLWLVDCTDPHRKPKSSIRSLITLNSHDSFAVNKGTIQRQLGIPMDGMSVYFESEECTDDKTIRHFRIKDNDELILLPSDLSGVPQYQVFFKTFLGRTVALKVRATDSILMVKRQILEHEGIPLEEQQLVFAGSDLENGCRLFEYNIQKESTLQRVWRFRGMNSSFTFQDTSDPLVRYLMLPEEERQKTRFPMAALQAKVDLRRQDDGYEFEEDGGIVSVGYRAVIGQFMDFMWSKKMNNENGVDMTVVLPNEIFRRLLRPYTHRNHDHHVEQYSPEEVVGLLNRKGPGIFPKIALRMTKGPTNACINFHQDGESVQMDVNGPGDYQGGKLCYFTGNRLHVLTCPAGSFVRHCSNVPYAVTALTAGVRKSLFLSPLPWRQRCHYRYRK